MTVKEKTPLSHEVVYFQMFDFETSSSKLEVSKFMENYLFLENYITSEGAVSHKVLCYQPLPITSYLLRFYVHNYFE